MFFLLILYQYSQFLSLLLVWIPCQVIYFVYIHTHMLDFLQKLYHTIYIVLQFSFLFTFESSIGIFVKFLSMNFIDTAISNWLLIVTTGNKLCGISKIREHLGWHSNLFWLTFSVPENTLIIHSYFYIIVSKVCYIEHGSPGILPSKGFCVKEKGETDIDHAHWLYKSWCLAIQSLIWFNTLNPKFFWNNTLFKKCFKDSTVNFHIMITLNLATKFFYTCLE